MPWTSLWSAQSSELKLVPATEGSKCSSIRLPMDFTRGGYGLQFMAAIVCLRDVKVGSASSVLLSAVSPSSKTV